MANNGNRNNRPNNTNNQQKPAATTPAPTATEGETKTPADDSTNQTTDTGATDQQNNDQTSQEKATDTGASEQTGDEGTQNQDDTSKGDAPAPDTVVQANNQSNEQAATATVVDETTSDDAPVDEAPAQETDTDPLVAELNVLLDAFVEANQVMGSKPEDFRSSATAAVVLTRFVIKFPTLGVLSALLDFFREHQDDVCKGENFLKGSVTLNKSDEQKVGFLYNMFITLAANQKVRMESSKIISILGKAEFVTFYNRRLAAMNQAG